MTETRGVECEKILLDTGGIQWGDEREEGGVHCLKGRMWVMFVVLKEFSRGRIFAFRHPV